MTFGDDIDSKPLLYILMLQLKLTAESISEVPEIGSSYSQSGPENILKNKS